MDNNFNRSRYTRQPPEGIKSVPRANKHKLAVLSIWSEYLRPHWWKYLVGLLIFILLSFFIQNYIMTRSKLKELTNSKLGLSKTEQQLMNQLSTFIILPQDETPTIATVNDASKLNDQVFFLNAKNGDKVIIFSKAKTAILYRPSEKKIVEYAPINVGGSK